MKIGILGSGIVGRTLAIAFHKAGHEIKLGTDHPDKKDLQAWAEENSEEIISTFSEAAQFGEALILCTNWSGTESVINLAGKENCKDKLIIDTTNPLDNKGPDANGLLSFTIGLTTSAGEQVQSWLPQSNIVKALNSVGFALMDHPHFTEGAPTMFIAGNDEAAKNMTAQLLHDIGWEDVADMGAVEMCRNIEPLCNLWCAYGFRNNTWNHAFKLLRK